MSNPSTTSTRRYATTTTHTLETLGRWVKRRPTYADGRLRGEITNRNEAINAPIQGTSADVLKRPWRSPTAP